jgi:hypothetical protein
MQQDFSIDPQLRAVSAPRIDSAPMSADAVAERLEHLGSLPLKQALPMLLLELSRLREARMDAEERVELMQALKRPVLKAAASLPKPTPGSRTALRAAGGMTLEQRLIHMMIGNLRQTLYDYDRAQGSRLVEDDGRRVWLLQQVFRFFVRQMRYAVDWERPWPVHTWQDLHDLFVYLVVRGSVPLDSAFTVAAFDDEFDAAVEYKRLLLLGLVDGLTQRRAQTDAYFHLLKRWAADSSLVEPEKAMGRQDVIAVHVTQDAPPQLVRGKLTISFRGWVLRPAEGCVSFIAQMRRSGRVSAAAGGGAEAALEAGAAQRQI